ncbi:hypothetical protein ABVT39_024758 [Epinephelus coioides]
MDRRPNYRYRPANEAAGRLGPPQHHHHQHNCAAWRNQEQEFQKTCHIIRKKNDQIKRLEELLEARDEGFSSECKKQAERVCKLETDNYQLTLCLQRQERESKQQFEEMVTRYEAEKQTASDQIKKVLRQEVESQVQSEYQEKEAQMTQQISQMGTDLLKLREEQQGLLHAVMTTKDAALQQSEEVWQVKYEAVSEKLAAENEENTKRWETQEKDFTIKVSLMEEQLHQRDLEILRLTEDDDCLVKKLSETTEELSVRMLSSSRARHPGRINSRL